MFCKLFVLVVALVAAVTENPVAQPGLLAYSGAYGHAAPLVVSAPATLTYGIRQGGEECSDYIYDHNCSCFICV